MSRKGGVRDPFLTYDRFNTMRPDRSVETFNPVTPGLSNSAKIKASPDLISHTESLPRNLFYPEDAQSMEIRVAATVAAGATVELTRFICPRGATAFFLSYTVVCLPFATPILFVPKVNGQRVLPYHGRPNPTNPNSSFDIDLASSSDGFTNTQTPIMLQLQPGDILTWDFFNGSAGPVQAAIGMNGYIDKSLDRKTGRFGG